MDKELGVSIFGLMEVSMMEGGEVTMRVDGEGLYGLMELFMKDNLFMEI